MEGDPFDTTVAAISIGTMVVVNISVCIYGYLTRIVRDTGLHLQCSHNRTHFGEVKYGTGVVYHYYIGALDQERIIHCQKNIEGKLQRSDYEGNCDKMVIGTQRGDKTLTIECITDYKIERTILIGNNILL